MLSLASSRRAKDAVLRPLDAQFERRVKGCQEKTAIWVIELMAPRSDQEHVAFVHAVGGTQVSYFPLLKWRLRAAAEGSLQALGGSFPRWHEPSYGLPSRTAYGRSRRYG